MARDLSDVNAVIRAAQEQQRLVKELGGVSSIVAQAEGMRDMVAPPYLGEFRQAHERMDRLGLANALPNEAAVIKNLLPDAKALGGPLAKQLVVWASERIDPFAGMKSLVADMDFGKTLVETLGMYGQEYEVLTRTAGVLKAFRPPDYTKEFHDIFKITSVADSMFASLPHHRFADMLAISDLTRTLIEYDTGRLNRAYAGFSASLMHDPEWLASAPEFVRFAPAEVVFSQARVVRAITTHEEEVDERSAADEIWTGVQDRTLGYIEVVLPELSPRLMESWNGIWDAVRRRGQDWVRHAGSSLRFLLIEALDTVAPIDKLTDVPRQYYRDGKIMRPGQIHWLCVPLNNRTYRRVARADVESAISIIDAMSEAIHRDDYPELEDAFDTMAVRASIALCNLLRLWKTRH